MLEALGKKPVKDASMANEVIFLQAQHTQILKTGGFLMFAKQIVTVYVLLRKSKLFYCFK